MTPERHEKVWGCEWWLENGPKGCLKILVVNPGFQCSLHMHPIKSERFIIADGIVTMLVGGMECSAKQGMSFDVPAGTHHKFGSFDGAVLLEVSTFHSDDDVVRLTQSGPIPQE